MPKNKAGVPIKGKIFTEARDWCLKNDLPFPFHLDLKDIRNAEGHSDYSVNAEDGSICIFSEDGSNTKFTHKEFSTGALWDICLAHQFPLGLVYGIFSARNESGEYDTAWEQAKACIPNLETIVCDPDELDELDESQE